MKINQHVLGEILRHYRKMNAWHHVKGLSYERCAELAYIIDHLRPRFHEPLRYLDIGSGGDSPLPTYLLKQTAWQIWCIDKCDWVLRQHEYAAHTSAPKELKDRFSVLHDDLLTANLPEASFDIITNISVIEHFEGETDSRAMSESARLLRPGGIYLLTTLINDGHFKEHYVQRSVYGKPYSRSPVFYQRHYDLASLEQRLIGPAGLRELQRVYFGDYGFQCFERLYQKPPKLFRMFYHWTQPILATRFLTYRDTPISRPNMSVNTASGAIVVMTNQRQS